MGVYEPTGEFRNFNSTKSSGDYGEELLKKYILHKGFQVIDRADDAEYRAKDIDFEFSKNGVNWRSVEVKTDNRMAQTGNIVVEVAMYRQSGKRDGWLYYCEADYLCFIDINNYIFYFFDWSVLKAEVLKGRWKIVNFSNGTDNCRGEVCKIPLKDLFNLGIVKVYDRINFR